jgi:crotonobetainyl-CoA:carnitine CoA-transferase CaiB-like acyl-CoA transferase
MKHGVVSGAFQDLAEVVDHPHTRHTEMIIEREGYRGTGIPIKLNSSPGSVRTLPPYFGVAADEVLADHGFSSEQIARLVDEGVVWRSRAK